MARVNAGPCALVLAGAFWDLHPAYVGLWLSATKESSMKNSATLKVRPSLDDLQDEFENGDKTRLDDLVRAWKGIKDLPPTDPNSFFVIGGYHGEPFRGAGWGDPSYWGGYCNHGNVLFPTWHRAYLLKLEAALQSIPGCSQVMLPYWNETAAPSKDKAIPWALTNQYYTLDDVQIDNPLRSFVLPANITDHVGEIDDNNNPADYSKPQGYETVRYPLSGLVGAKDIEHTTQHNKKFGYPNPTPDAYAKLVSILNVNLWTWLTKSFTVGPESRRVGGVASDYAACLKAPNFTVFSNTTSAAEWNADRAGNSDRPVVPLERPHNSIHLAVGGFDVPSGDLSRVPGANGDMGENDTAALDPIFFFHHCFVDKMFWQWQQTHNSTDALDIIAGYPGTNSVDAQGPTPGVAPNSWLSLDSRLDPFTLVEDGQERGYTSRDLLNIETQLGYTYNEERDGSAVGADAQRNARSSKIAVISGVNRAPIRGSFLISLFRTVDGKHEHLGSEAVFSRWHVKYCANCQTHLEVRSFVELPDDDIAADALFVEIHTRDGVHSPIEERHTAGAALAEVDRLDASLTPKVEIR